MVHNLILTPLSCSKSPQYVHKSMSPIFTYLTSAKNTFQWSSNGNIGLHLKSNKETLKKAKFRTLNLVSTIKSKDTGRTTSHKKCRLSWLLFSVKTNNSSGFSYRKHVLVFEQIDMHEGTIVFTFYQSCFRVLVTKIGSQNPRFFA